MNTQTTPNAKSGSVKFAISLALACTALTLASCASRHSPAPEQVAASNPTVTYKYRNDNELVQANQQAITYCQQYQSMPRALSFSHDSDMHNIVIFECAASTTFAHPVPQFNFGLAYNYRTDQELLNISRDAQVYCLNSGAPEMTSNIDIHSNGNKTVTFRCSTR